MQLGKGTLPALGDLLKECSAHLVSDEGRGSGFFVDDRHLLTSAHVVGAPGTELSVQPYGRDARTGTVVEVEAELTDDLALVHVDRDGDEEPQPAVVFERGMADGIDYLAVGYPSGDLVDDAGIEGITYTGHPRRPAAGGPATLLKLEAGRASVTSGLSGGPVLNTETGAVVAVVQYSKDPDTDSGGGAIPIGRAADAFEVVKQAMDEPPTATRRWRDVLGADAWQALGYRWGWNRMIEVRVTGTREGWEVQVDPDDEAPHEVTTESLPKDVFRALFSWAERRRVRDVEEVGLLGRLLATAVFPSKAASRVLSERLDDELLLRLHFDSDSDLFDVPWEFVTVAAGEEDRHIAADDTLGLVRVGRHPDPGDVTTAPFHGDAHVIGIVIEPDEYQPNMPELYDVRWPKAGQIMEAQQEAVVGSHGFKFIPEPNPTSVDVSDRLEEGLPDEDASIEVVHYIGFGQLENGKARVAFSDGEDGVYWRPATDLFKWVAGSGARLLVAEFMLPPVAMDFEPLPPRIFLGALSKRVNAVVFTRFPVHARELNPFNKTLYEALGKGASIEMAVQLARKKVDGLQALGDAAGFGAFSLITGERPDMRLVPVEVTSPLDPVAAQERGGGRTQEAERPARAETTFVGSR